MEDSAFRFLINLTKGPKDERDIDSREFLLSYIKAGAWIRVISAYRLMQNYNMKDASMVERVAYQTGFFQMVGSQIEDLGTMLVATSAWAQDRTASLPNVFGKIFIRNEPRKRISDPKYYEKIHSELLGTKKSVSVDPRTYFDSISNCENDVLSERILGYRWRKNPSARMVLKGERQSWELFPMALRELCDGFSSPSHPLLSIMHNKLKHGPQFVLQNVHDVAVQRRGFSEAQVTYFNVVFHRAPAVRLLFKGERVQETTGELEGGERVAPFLVDHPVEIEKTFYRTMVFQAVLMSLIATWNLRLLTREPIALDDDERVRQIRIEYARYLGILNDSGWGCPSIGT